MTLKLNCLQQTELKEKQEKRFHTKILTHLYSDTISKGDNTKKTRTEPKTK